MAKLGRIVGTSLLVLVGVGAVAVGAGYLTVSRNFAAARAVTYEVHDADFPVPWPLSEEEVAELRAERLAAMEPVTDEATGEDAGGVVLASIDQGTADEVPAPDPLEGVDLEAIAMERAQARGKHLVEARYACVACHGTDFSGATMVEDPAMGTWLGPNLTLGAGSAVADYSPNDWDRIIRHGVRPDGTSALMPSDDFTRMSDKELSDMVAYITSRPPVDNDVPEPTYGPLYSVLVATGQLNTSADRLPHDTPHPTLPPATEPTADFGAHLAGVCYGCHRADLTGGRIEIGPPDWPPASNLTAANETLHALSFEEFDALMRTGKRPDGTDVQPPMIDITVVAKANTDTEMRALYAYITSLEAKPTRK